MGLDRRSGNTAVANIPCDQRVPDRIDLTNDFRLTLLITTEALNHSDIQSLTQQFVEERMLFINIGGKRKARIQGQFAFLNQERAIMDWTEHDRCCLLTNITSELQSERHRHGCRLSHLGQFREAIFDLRINVVLLTVVRQLSGKLTFLHHFITGDGDFDLSIFIRRDQFDAQQSIAIANNHWSSWIDLLPFFRRSGFHRSGRDNERRKQLLIKGDQRSKLFSSRDRLSQEGNGQRQTKWQVSLLHGLVNSADIALDFVPMSLRDRASGRPIPTALSHRRPYRQEILPHQC